MHRAINYASADCNRIAADIERLFEKPIVIENQRAILKSTVDSVLNGLAGCFLTAALSNEWRELVSRFAEDMAAPVWIVHSSQKSATLWAIPARARR